MLAKNKVIILVAIQIALIISSFLSLAILEQEKDDFLVTQLVIDDTRHLVDSVMFETERYINGVPYANPHALIKTVNENMIIIKNGGTTHGGLELIPLIDPFIEDCEIVEKKLLSFTNNIETILNTPNYDPDPLDALFIDTDTKRFDVNGALSYFSDRIVEAENQKDEQLIALEIDLAIINTGVHIGMVILIVNILNRESARRVKLEKLASIGELAARVAHDLRNPLAVIKGVTELLHTSNLDEKTQERVDILDASVNRMAHQVDDVLDFARTKPLRMIGMNFLKILLNAIENCKLPNTIKISLPKNNPVIYCDPERMQSVFENLLINASDAIHEKGTIEIRVNKEGTQIEFQDSGYGIDKKNLGNLFEPLYTTKQAGTGLGLPSCKSIIEQHGGTISVAIKPTVFTINLPPKQSNSL